MLTDIHEKFPSDFRKMVPQFIKEFYAYQTVILRKIMTYLHFWISDDVIEDFFNRKKIFFILSIGRSGTNWLARLLNRAPYAYVTHEPFIEAIPHQEAFNNLQKADEYIHKFRKKEIYLRIHKLNIQVYGEVNSFLRRHCYAIKKAFPKVMLIHLVRDGRDVVRSMYSRETMTPGAYDTKRIYPKEDDLFRKKWNKMTRFEKLCWYWMIENRYLRECIGEYIQFERILSEYEYFKERVLKPLGLNIPKRIWEEEVKKPKNITIKYKLPHWKKWSREMKEIFEYICGDEMRKLGYEINW